MIFMMYCTGAILEIGLRVGVLPLNVTPGLVLLTIFLTFLLTKKSSEACCV